MLRGIRSVFKSQKNPLKSLYINTINKRFCSTELPPELQATEVLLDLLRYDNNERGNLWFQRFYNSLKTASLKGKTNNRFSIILFCIFLSLLIN